MEPENIGLANLLILITPVIAICLIVFMDQRPSWPADEDF